MISLRPLHIIDMGSVQIGFEPFQVLIMIKQEQIMLTLNMPEVMPVAHMRIVGKLSQQTRHFQLTGNLFKMTSTLDAQHQIELLCLISQSIKSLTRTFVIDRSQFHTPPHIFSL